MSGLTQRVTKMRNNLHTFIHAYNHSKYTVLSQQDWNIIIIANKLFYKLFPVPFQSM